MSKLKNTFKPMWLIAPAIVVAWMLVMYFLKDVYPFGESTLIGYDLKHGNVPAMYYVYDAWHSGDFSRLFYDFTTAGGFSREIIFTIFQPRFLFTLFWERENLTYAVDVFYIVEFALIALSASYSFSKLFPKLASPWVVMISVMYAFNGFSLLYFTNIDWLDTVMLYPLIMLFALNMIKGKSKVPFFVVLTYTLTLNTYMAFFVMLSLIIFGGLYIFIVEAKENRKTAILNLGIGTGASLLASSYSIVAYVISMLSTARVDEGSYVLDGYTGYQEKLTGLGGILSAPNEIDIVAIFMFLGTSVALASLVVLWVHFKKHKDSRKYTIFFTITTLLFVLQIVFKSVMLIWHLGSYQKFPFRNGFMVSFFCCCIVAYYFSRFGSLEGVKTKLSVVNFFTFVPAFFAAIAVASYADVFIFTLKNNFYVLNSYTNYQTGGMAYPFTGFALATIACFLLIKLVDLKALRNVLTFVLVMVVVGINSFYLIAECTYSEEVKPYTKEFELRENFEQKDVLSRVGNNDGVLIMNYPYMAGASAVSNWTHTLPGDHLKTFSDLGFCSFFTYVYDMGGTVFSRALLRLTDTVSESKLDNALYTEYKNTDLGMNYYHNNFKLPVGLVFNETIKNVSIDNCSNLFEYQNDIYNALDGSSDLFEKVEYKSVTEKIKKEKYYVNREKEDGSGKGIFVEKKPITTATYTFDVKEKSVLYLHNSNLDEDFAFIELSVNGEAFHIYDANSSIGLDSESLNKAYSNGANNGILELGVFENETVKVRIKFMPESKTTEAICLYLMNLEKMEALCKASGDNVYSVENGTVTVKTDGEKGDIAFIPLTYDEDWKCTVNGKERNPVCIVGNFMGLELDAGENEIFMEFSKKDSYIKICLTVLGLLLARLVLLVEKRIKFPKCVYTLTFVAFAVILIGAVTAIYIVPSVWSIVTNIIALFKG